MKKYAEGEGFRIQSGSGHGSDLLHCFWDRMNPNFCRTDHALTEGVPIFKNFSHRQILVSKIF